MKLEDLIPKRKDLVINLVKQAGIDVSDWENVRGGTNKAARNPKYCYDWAFVQPQKIVVLNLWHSNMIEHSGEIFQDLNIRADAEYYSKVYKKPVWSRRAFNMDRAIQTALKDKLIVRIIICDGKILRERTRNAKASQVKKRMLDPIPWTITNYNWETGECKLMRGIKPSQFVDQFILREENQNSPQIKDVRSKIYVRNANVRINVLIRSNGQCEYCGKPGFKMIDNRTYLETHHIISLSDCGADNESNVVALCPDHHREAHYGINKNQIKTELLYKMKFL